MANWMVYTAVESTKYSTLVVTESIVDVSYLLYS